MKVFFVSSYLSGSGSCPNGRVVMLWRRHTSGTLCPLHPTHHSSEWVISHCVFLAGVAGCLQGQGGDFKWEREFACVCRRYGSVSYYQWGMSHSQKRGHTYIHGYTKYTRLKCLPEYLCVFQLTPVNTVVFTVQATDADNDRIIYSIDQSSVSLTLLLLKEKTPQQQICMLMHLCVFCSLMQSTLRSISPTAERCSCPSLSTMRPKPCSRSPSTPR